MGGRGAGTHPAPPADDGHVRPGRRPRITHIWPFPDLNARLEIRGESYARDLAPENGPENIAHATSTIALPTPISPLR
ncbi:NIPSNAP family protein [Streptomyces sp. M19]